jgi:hypothetical protein
MKETQLYINNPSIIHLVKSLSKEEKVIYDAIMRDFPSTDPYSAYNKAIEGGVKFNFIYK